MRAAALLCLLVVLGGCVGAGAGGASTPAPTPEPSDAAPTPTPEPTPTDAASAGPPEASTAVEEPDNPWNADPVTVDVAVPEDDNRSYRPLVERALRFWEDEGTGYDLRYRVVDDADADVRVRFVGTVVQCDGTYNERDVGCADYIPKNGTAYGQTLVRIETGYTDESTVETIKHEVGHTLGYGHDDTDAYGFMAATTPRTRLPTPDATSLENPWKRDTLRVYADYPDVIESQRSEYEEAVERAVEYYRTDEESTLPPGVSLELTENRSEAEIVVEFPGTGSSHSVGERHGYNVDADEAFEQYTRYEITVNSIDRDRVAWHVGYWLGWAFGAESQADLPPPFDEPHYDDREDWS